MNGSIAFVINGVSKRFTLLGNSNILSHQLLSSFLPFSLSFFSFSASFFSASSRATTARFRRGCFSFLFPFFSFFFLFRFNGATRAHFRAANFSEEQIYRREPRINHARRAKTSRKIYPSDTRPPSKFNGPRNYPPPPQHHDRGG